MAAVTPPEQVQRFSETADRDRLAGAWRLTSSGMTRADVLGLRWSDVDLAAGVVTRVSQGRVALDHGHSVDDPNCAARRRASPVEQIWPDTMEKLRTMKAGQAADRLSLGSRSPDTPTFVVLDVLGRPVRPE